MIRPRNPKKERPNRYGWYFFRAVVGTTFFTDDEKGNDQDEEIADADLLHRWNFAAHTDNDLHGGERKRGQDHKEDALLFLCDIHDVLL